MVLPDVDARQDPAVVNLHDDFMNEVDGKNGAHGLGIEVAFTDGHADSFAEDADRRMAMMVRLSPAGRPFRKAARSFK